MMLETLKKGYFLFPGLRMRDISLGITRTVAIEHIPHKLCTIENIRDHFQEQNSFS